MPHISLIYGDLPDDVKAAARQRLSKRLSKTTIVNVSTGSAGLVNEYEYMNP